MKTSANTFEEYLQGLRLVRGSGAGVDELSYYHALATLLNETGKTLKPNVRCVMNLRNRGAGLPDGGLFTPDQIGRNLDEAQILEGVPARGAIEVKGTAEDIDVLAASEQVQRYCQAYGQVLVTNLYGFSLVVWDRGAAVPMETYRLADDERDFWSRINHPRALSEEHGQRFVEYLRRVMLHGAPLGNPQDLAWLLASYAREARMRIENIQLHALTSVRTALEDALGLTFEGERGDHFFRSTLVQTLFYGAFSAWVLWHHEYRPDESEQFRWRDTTWILHVPMIRALFEQIATPSRLGALNLVEVLDWAGSALNRVDRPAFFERFEQANAVQYFYEPFLEAFDPELRKDLGIWYTPDEVVKYMVARVDRVLREELDLPDGLADSSVYVLDPATGTGSYLVEVLRRIEQTLRERGDDALAAHDVKQAAMQRVIGFEILPAPFVVGHLQVGLYLQSIGAPLSDERQERAAIYLTNALTGWQSGTASGQEVQSILAGYPELLEERDQAQTVKQKTPVLVVLGNPPYNGYAGIAMGQERVLTDAYRSASRTRQPQGQGLNDLYVRFFRMAERRIVEGTGRGVVCMISNYSWLDGLSFTGMRERYLDVFDRIWIDCLNGDKYKTGKETPEGLPDPSIFSTERNREGIQVGTAIATLVRNTSNGSAAGVEFRHLWGREKRAELLASADADTDTLYEHVEPPVELGLPFMPLQSEAAYFEWPSLPDLFPTSYPGVKTSRDDVVVDIDRDRLIRRMEQYFDPNVSHDEMRRIAPRAVEDASRFDAYKVREHLIGRGFLRDKIIRYCYRPFDLRWLYWEPETKLLDEKRSEYFPQVFTSNLWIGAAQRHRKNWDPPIISSALASLHVIERGASLFPLKLRSSFRDMGSLFAGLDESNLNPDGHVTFNLSTYAQIYLSRITPPRAQREYLFIHVFAILHSPVYRRENAGALQQDWPRIPLPDTADRLVTSSGLGRQVAALLDTETAVVGVTSGAIRPELRVVGMLARVGGGGLNPDAGDLAVTAGWGYGGRGGITMPGRGRAVEREFTPEERDGLEAGALALALEPDEAFARLGGTTFDVYLNDVACWENVPSGVWEYTIGGYQVMKKWLSYREQPLLGRPLTAAEAREVTAMARRITALLLLGPALDASYTAVKASTYAWGGDG